MDSKSFPKFLSKDNIRKILPYILLIFVVLLILEIFMGIFNVSWNMPFSLSGDNNLFYMFAKGIAPVIIIVTFLLSIKILFFGIVGEFLLQNMWLKKRG